MAGNAAPSNVSAKGDEHCHGNQTLSQQTLFLVFRNVSSVASLFPYFVIQTFLSLSRCSMLAVAFVVFALFSVGVSKYDSGHLVTHENWAFLSRFCFLSETGEFQYEIEYSENNGPVNLLLYYDTEDQWPSVYRTNKTCQQKEAVLNVNFSQVVNLTVDFEISGCRREAVQSGTQGLVKGSPIVRCTKARRFRTARERWWFIAVSNCNASRGLNLRYKFTMTNGPPGDYWHEHLSADEFYILPVLIAYTVAYLFVLLAVVMCSVELKARQFLHATYKLFIISVALQQLGVMAQAVAYGQYAMHGTTYPRARNFGRIVEAASEMSFLLLLLLLAKGYTVTRARLRLGSSIKLTIFSCLYTVLTLCLFVYEKEYFDPGEVLYLYESPAGYGVITLRIVAWWMFIYSTVFTLKHYPEKAAFYYPFNLIGTLWFVAGPAFILAANSLIDKWVRESVVCAVMHFIAFAGHILFLVLTMPSKANKNFPYHVRTNQIGVMEITGCAGNNSLYHFSHHNYDVQNGRTVPIDLFTVSKAVQLETSAAEYETQPFPHDARGYTQTILVPFTVRDGPCTSDEEAHDDHVGEITPYSGSIQRFASPHDSPDLNLRTGPSPAQSLHSLHSLHSLRLKASPARRPEAPVLTARSAQMPRELRHSDRQVVSAGAPRTDAFIPSAPLEDGGEPESRDSASTLSAGTAETRQQQQQLTVDKLTDMFLANSLRQPD